MSGEDDADVPDDDADIGCSSEDKLCEFGLLAATLSTIDECSSWITSEFYICDKTFTLENFYYKAEGFCNCLASVGTEPAAINVKDFVFLQMVVHSSNE